MGKLLKNEKTSIIAKYYMSKEKLKPTLRLTEEREWERSLDCTWSNYMCWIKKTKLLYDNFENRKYQQY